ncbi:MAG TPA: carboxymuconolactone decarboxylase family protein, partial [bacterium]|nr:carboxymuconolactone decarboxylase family protein [bacterium]
MPHISLPPEFPGIRSLFVYCPESAGPLNDLVQTILHDPSFSTLTPGERELIATYTSALNTCKYCTSTHGAIAKYQLGGNGDLVKAVVLNPAKAEISEKLKALLAIAAKVQVDG